MEKNVCATCFKPKATLSCGICIDPICKNCAQFVPEDTFAFLRKKPENLNHSVYCLSCYNTNVEQALADYNDTLEKAKEIMIFTKSQAKETRFVKRLEDPFKISDSFDKDEVVMKMAFWAVQMNYNAVIDVDVQGEKIRDGSYQTQRFHGTGIAAQVIESKLIKDRSFSSTPN